MSDQIKNETSPAVEAIKILLQSDKIEEVKEGLKQFWLYVQQNSSSRNNATYYFFGVDKKGFEYKLLEVPIMKALLEKFGTQLDTESLLYTVRAGLLSTIYDNFKMVLEVTKIFIERKDIVGQNGVVEAFHNACEYYDGGHRAQANTVQDNLIDKYFSNFEGEPLVNLLAGCSHDQLESETGDCMDVFFASTFERIKDKALEKQLIERFSSYVTDYIERYENKEYIEDQGLLEGFENASPEVKAAIKKLKAKIGSDDEEESDQTKRRFEFSEGDSNKFWEIEVEGESFTVTYGKIGTSGTTQTKDFDSEEECTKQAEKLITEKTKKGYEEVGLD